MDLTAYSLTIEWRIDWFSVSAQKPMDAQQDKGISRFRTTDGVFEAHNEAGILTPRLKADHAFGQINISTDVHNIFTVVTHVQLGKVMQSESMLAPPLFARLFMLKILGAEDDPTVAVTELIFQGVIKTGSRPLDLLLPHYFFYPYKTPWSL